MLMIAAASMDSQQQAVPGAMVLCAVSVLLGQALKENENSSKNFEDVHKRNHHHSDMFTDNSGNRGSRGTGCGTGGSERNIRGTGSEI